MEETRKMDWHAWMDQHIPATVIQRGGATAWPKGGQGLVGDSLGPIMHLHDGASEIFYFLAGRCRLQIGISQDFFGPGLLVLLPPEGRPNGCTTDDTASRR